jgi:hypothetical protein
MSTACTIGAFLIPVRPMVFTALDETPCNPNAEALHRVVKTNVNAVFMVLILTNVRQLMVVPTKDRDSYPVNGVNCTSEPIPSILSEHVSQHNLTAIQKSSIEKWEEKDTGKVKALRSMVKERVRMTCLNARRAVRICTVENSTVPVPVVLLQHLPAENKPFSDVITQFLLIGKNLLY